MRGWVQGEARRRADSPGDELLAIFDLYDVWFHCDDYEVCSFVNVLRELVADHPAGRASIEHLITGATSCTVSRPKLTSRTPMGSPARGTSS